VLERRLIVRVIVRVIGGGVIVGTVVFALNVVSRSSETKAVSIAVRVAGVVVSGRRAV